MRIKGDAEIKCPEQCFVSSNHSKQEEENISQHKTTVSSLPLAPPSHLCRTRGPPELMPTWEALEPLLSPSFLPPTYVAFVALSLSIFTWGYQQGIFKIFLSIWLYQVLVAACGTQLPDQGLNPGFLLWELRVLATGHQGSLSIGNFLKYYNSYC